MALKSRAFITDRRLLKQSVSALAIVLAPFILAKRLGLEPGSIALFGVATLIIVRALETTGVIAGLARELVVSIPRQSGARGVRGAVILSAFIIPFVAEMIPLIRAIAPSFGGHAALMPLWWACRSAPVSAATARWSAPRRT